MWQIEDLLDTVKLEVEAREVCETTKTTENGPHDRSKDGINPQATSTAKGMLAGTKNGEVNLPLALKFNVHFIMSGIIRHHAINW